MEVGNDDELELAVYEKTVRKYLKSAPLWRSEIQYLYGNRTLDFLDALDQLLGDLYFYCHADQIAYQLLQERRKNFYRYRFVHIPVDRNGGPLNLLGCTHLMEVPFVFGCGDCGLMFNKDFTVQKEKALAEDMSNRWTNFATTGNPNEGPHSIATKWPLYAPKRKTFIFASNPKTAGTSTEFPVKQCGAINPTWFLRNPKEIEMSE